MYMLNTTQQTFDLLRFDFLIDEALKVYLMEVNLSPNITPTSAKYEQNAKFREQMVHDALTLVGAGSYFDMMFRFVWYSLNFFQRHPPFFIALATTQNQRKWCRTSRILPSRQNSASKITATKTVILNFVSFARLAWARNSPKACSQLNSSTKDAEAFDELIPDLSLDSVTWRSRTESRTSGSTKNAWKIHSGARIS